MAYVKAYDSRLTLEYKMSAAEGFGVSMQNFTNTCLKLQNADALCMHQFELAFNVFYKKKILADGCFYIYIYFSLQYLFL
jgi:hypothetical protein